MQAVATMRAVVTMKSAAKARRRVMTTMKATRGMKKAKTKNNRCNGEYQHINT